ncbi:MAG: hypothetical protein M3N18_01415, partial [Actinomycetota bacterium]|nr:hypothetical protein [Actinomycetota bacterium]
MILKGRESADTKDEPRRRVVVFWRSEPGGDVGAVEVACDGITMHSHIHQRRARHVETFIPFCVVGDVRQYFAAVQLFSKNSTSVTVVSLDD